MIKLPDYIYERSVIKQLYLKEESRHLFQSNAYSVSICGQESEAKYYTEASEFLSFKGNLELKEEYLNDIIRKIMCAGGSLTELRAEVVFTGEFDEAELRKFAASFKKTVDSVGAHIKRVAVYLQEGNETGQSVFLLGRGPVKTATEAPWMRRVIYPEQDVILTGSLGKYGMIELFNRNKEELNKVFPAVFMEKIKTKKADRLPYIEVESVGFYKTTALVPLGAGGLLAGLWNLGEREDGGLTIYADRLAYEQETIELCNHFDLNPLELDSRGSYLMAAGRGEELVYVLRSAGIKAVCIGKVTEDKKRVIMFDDEERFLESPKYKY